MDSIVYPVDWNNCDEVARVLVRVMCGVSFSATLVVDGTPLGTGLVIRNLSLWSQGSFPGFNQALGYIFENGRLAIPLYPMKKIFWDLNTEKVEVTIFSRGSGFINIKKTRGNQILPTMMIVFD